MTMRPIPFFVVCMLVVGSFARADTREKQLVPDPVVARVVGFEVSGDATIVTIAAGSEQGLAKTWRAHFREGKTPKVLAGGDAVIIRIDRRTSVLKTKLTAAQVRANVFVQLDP
jgi:hypothetical protein